MSWVFLTAQYVYKMKKPVQYERLDFSSVEKRYFYIREEVRLNRRLAPDVYLGSVPLTRQDDGSLQLDGDGTPVEWLVKMRRLPADRMLDYMIEHDSVDHDAVEKAARRLTAFYRQTPPVELSTAEYRRRFHELLDYSHARLDGYKEWIPFETARKIRKRQNSFMSREGNLLDERARANRIVEAHGDLRPQHICLTEEPVIYDCMEFSRVLRQLDPADELAYLSLECSRLNDSKVPRIFWDHYREQTEDRVSDRLIMFYTSVRSCQRAQLVLRHLDEPDTADPQRWIDRAVTYLDRGASAVDRLYA